MADPNIDTSLRHGRGPWFRQHPRLAIAVAAGLTVAVFVLRMAVSGGEDSISVLYVLPVALIALSFGFRAGTAAGVVAVGLLVAWVLVSGESLSPLGWISRATPALLLGGLVGFASDSIRDAHRAERRAIAVALLQREAAEINDGIVQGLAATKWLFEAGDVDAGLTMLEENIEAAQQLVTRTLGSGSPLSGEQRWRPLDSLRSGVGQRADVSVGAAPAASRSSRHRANGTASTPAARPRR